MKRAPVSDIMWENVISLALKVWLPRERAVNGHPCVDDIVMKRII
jgi:hypothetical protein